MSDTQTQATIAAIEHFNTVFNEHDVDAIMAAMTDDCVFENTFPPLGRFEGQVAVRALWERLFTASPKAHFDTEELFACSDRCVSRWCGTGLTLDGLPGESRGVDIFRVRDGKVAEKLAYNKG